MNDIYNDGTYLKANSTWHEEDSPWKAQQIIKLFQRNSLDPSEVCEVGCGSGGILNYLSNRYKKTNFWGYDISRQAHERCRGKEKDNLSFILGDVFADQEQKYDVAMAIDVFEHVEDYFGFLRKFKNWLSTRFSIFLLTSL